VTTRTPPTTLGVEALEARDVPAVFDALPVLPTSDPGVIDNARAIFAHGQQLGRRPDAFIKVGDSNTSTGYLGFEFGFLTTLGQPGYDPALSGLAATRPDLVGAWAAFREPVDGTGANSFDRVSTAAYPGWTVQNVLPALPGEVAATDAGLAFVMIGTNDLVVYANGEEYRTYLRQVVETLISSGVVPVLSTIPDHNDNPAYAPITRVFNQVIADTATEFRVPLWNLNVALRGLPAEGLDAAGVHLARSPNGAGNFTPADLAFGQNLRNLEALDILNWYRQVVQGPPEQLELPATWTPLPAGGNVFAVGRDVGQGPVVSVYDTDGKLLDRFQAYDPGFTGGVRAVVADVNGDSIPDVITAPGDGGGPVVRVFDGKDGSPMSSFFAFDPSFRNGFTVAAGDLDGDGKAEIVVGAGDGGGPQVAVFRGGDFAQVNSFFAFDPSFRGGVNVAVGTFAGIGPAVVAGAGAGGGPVVKLFKYGTDKEAESFFVYDGSARGGVFVAAGDLDGDGSDELVTAPSAGNPNVRVIDPATGAVRESFFAGDPAGTTGARVAVVGGRLLVGNGPGTQTEVQAYLGLSLDPHPMVDDPLRAYGVFIG
jgi:hypothetical protein